MNLFLFKFSLFIISIYVSFVFCKCENVGDPFVFFFKEPKCSEKGVFTPETVQAMCQQERVILGHPDYKNVILQHNCITTLRCNNQDFEI